MSGDLIDRIRELGAEVARLTEENRRLREDKVDLGQLITSLTNESDEFEAERDAARAELAKYRAALDPGNEEAVDIMARTVHDADGPACAWTDHEDEEEREIWRDYARRALTDLRDSVSKEDARG